MVYKARNAGDAGCVKDGAQPGCCLSPSPLCSPRPRHWLLWLHSDRPQCSGPACWSPGNHWEIDSAFSVSNPNSWEGTLTGRVKSGDSPSQSLLPREEVGQGVELPRTNKSSVH